jgi:hypothetical protein
MPSLLEAWRGHEADVRHSGPLNSLPVSMLMSRSPIRVTGSFFCLSSWSPSRTVFHHSLMLWAPLVAGHMWFDRGYFWLRDFKALPRIPMNSEQGKQKTRLRTCPWFILPGRCFFHSNAFLTDAGYSRSFSYITDSPGFYSNAFLTDPGCFYCRQFLARLFHGQVTSRKDLFSLDYSLAFHPDQFFSTILRYYTLLIYKRYVAMMCSKTIGDCFLKSLSVVFHH